eukprot:TRINITY_DN3704_c0_g1_i2.p1 TRINITY_DN3704_c0_g1~~TRINITY_DN3704_c0_g1_i2.p1  ORF type:complete len:190 (+),score=43.89 TRINITY_DN3704_c0_g1_i2:38-607(+)
MKSKINAGDLFAGLDDMPVGLDEEFEQERKFEAEAGEDKEHDMLLNFDSFSLDTLKALPVPLQIHLGVSLVVSIAVFFIFHYAAQPSPQEALEWWLTPWFFFAMSLTGHFYFLKREYWKGTIIILVILHVGLYIVNKSLTPEFDWFFYPLLGCAMAGVFLYYCQDKNGSLLFSSLLLFSPLFSLFSYLL